MTKKARILIVGIPTIFLLILIVLPNVLQPRVVTSQPACINLLREIEGAKDQWMTDNHKTTNDTPAWEDLRPYIKQVPLICPSEGIYTIGRVGELPTCSVAWHTEYWKTNHP